MLMKLTTYEFSIRSFDRDYCLLGSPFELTQSPYLRWPRYSSLRGRNRKTYSTTFSARFLH